MRVPREEMCPETEHLSASPSSVSASRAVSVLCFACRDRVNQLDPILVAAPFEGSLEPDANEFQSGFPTHHSLAERDDIRVVVLARKAGRFRIPTHSATDAFEPVGSNGFSIPRAAQNYPALEFMPADRFRYRRNE